MALLNEFRILVLLPRYEGAENALIECDIHTVSLSDVPQYEALSYVWGAPESQIPILVSGKEQKVTKNLHDALVRLRLASEKRMLWIDQLCINQWDSNEKAAQVQMMRQIYSNCSGCLLWLGDLRPDIPLADAEAALEFFEYLSGLGKAEDRDAFPTPSCMASEEVFQGPMKAINSINPDECSWWKRIWTVQEAVLPKNVTFIWGSLSVSWELLVGASNTWVTILLPAPARRLLASHLNVMGDLMCHVIWLRNAKDLYDCPLQSFYKWRYRLATDSRDKVYGLLGLHHAGTLPSVDKCDYTISSTKVFCSLTYDLILNEQSLLPLILDPRLEPERAAPGMPRWALDLSNFPKYYTDYFHFHSYSFYNANGDRELDVDSLLQLSQTTSECLTLRGTLVDTVDVVGKGFYHPQRETDPEAVLDILQEWQKLARDHERGTAPEVRESNSEDATKMTTFGHLMLGDWIRDENQYPKRAATENDVQSVLEFTETHQQNHTFGTVCGMMKNQTFFVTKSGLMGLAHLETRPGDEVWVLDGGRVPFTLRRRGDIGSPEFDFVGRCYVQGIMKGEIFDDQHHPTVQRSIQIH